MDFVALSQYGLTNKYCLTSTLNKLLYDYLRNRFNIFIIL